MATSMLEPGIFNHPRPKKSVLPPLIKRRRAADNIEEISFDTSKREEYLTGFHKRKVQRIKRAQVENEKKAKEERREMRKQLREERKEELHEHIKAVNRALRNAEGSDAEYEHYDTQSGVEDDDTINALPQIDHQEEYADEDRYTTVTVEAVHISKEGLQKLAADDDENEEVVPEQSQQPNEASGKGKEKWPKKGKPKKFRYESKAERRLSRARQKPGNRTRAARRDV